jgi:hypothetical protein
MSHLVVHHQPLQAVNPSSPIPPSPGEMPPRHMPPPLPGDEPDDDPGTGLRPDRVCRDPIRTLANPRIQAVCPIVCQVHQLRLASAADLLRGFNCTMTNPGIPDPSGPELPSPGKSPPTKPAPGDPPVPSLPPDPVPGGPLRPRFITG